MDRWASLLIWELGRASLSLAVAGLLAAAVLKCLRVQSPALHRTAWLATLLVGWALVRLPVDVPWYESRPAVAEQQPPPITAAPLPRANPPLADPPLAGAPLALPAVATEPVKVSPPPVGRISSAAPARDSASLRNSVAWPRIVVCLWLVGIAALLIRGLAGYLLFVARLPISQPAESAWPEELRRVQADQGSAGRIELRITADLGPMLCRLPRGYVLLVPAALWRSLGAAERQAILRHELAHRQRNDIWKSLAARALALPHWFNPVAWLAVRRFDEAAEWACDLAATGGEPTVYARMLVNLSELATSPSRFGSAMSGRPLAARIRRLATLRTKSDAGWKRALVGSFAVGMLVATIFRVQLVAQEPQPATAAPQEQNVQADRAEGGTRLDELRKEQTEMMHAAAKAFEAASASADSRKAPVDPVFVWSNRWLAADLELASSRPERIVAAKAHLQRMQTRRDKIAGLQKSGSPGGEANDVAAAAYYLAEAKKKLAEIESQSAITPATSSANFDDQAAVPIAGRQTYSAPAPSDLRVQVAVGGRMYYLDDPALVTALRAALLSDDLATLQNALVGVSVRSNPPYSGSRSVEFSELAPELIALLGHANGTIREWAEGTLLSMRTRIEPALEQAKESKNTEIARRAKKLLALTEPQVVTTVPALTPAATAMPAPITMPAVAPAYPQTALPYPTATPPGAARTRSPLYQDRTFAQWKEQLQTDLDFGSRIQALEAFRQFAANGFAEEVAQMVIETIGGYPLADWTEGLDENPDSEQIEQLFMTGVRAVRGGPNEITFPILSKSVRTGRANERIFAMMCVSIKNPEATPLLLEAMHDDDQMTRQLALSRLSEGDPALAARTIDEGLDSDDAITRLWAARTCMHLVECNLRPLGGFATHLSKRLGDPDPQVREAAYRALVKLGQDALPALKEAEASSDQTTATRALEARQAIEAKMSKSLPAPGSSS